MKLLNGFITLHLDLINLKINKKKLYICLNKNCKKHAIFNYKNLNSLKEINIRKFIYCKSHKLSNMINIKHKMCIKCNNSHPAFNYKNEKKALYCGKCKEIDMIDIKNKMCIKCNNSQPAYNYKNETKALYCGKCISSGMINFKSKLCIKCNNTIPIFNYKNEKKALFCGKCASPGMIDIKNKMCKTDLCDIFISNKQYKGFCLRCFIYNFPNSKIIRDYGTR